MIASFQAGRKNAVSKKLSLKGLNRLKYNFRFARSDRITIKEAGVMDASAIKELAAELLGRIREKKPLVHHITNQVVMNSTANATLALGASPIMAQAHEEMEALAGICDVLLLNIGTLTTYTLESMLIAGTRMSERGRPVILDPVGAGATAFRTEAVYKLLSEVKPTVLRGNASEIKALCPAGGEARIRGVDSLEEVAAVHDHARGLAAEHGMVVAVTGAQDFITDGRASYQVANGHPMFSRVTGTGCMATTACACFLAVADEPLTAVAAALACYGLAGEKAAQISRGPGAFQSDLLDILAGLSPDEILEKLRVF